MKQIKRMSGKTQTLLIILSQVLFHVGIAQTGGLKFNLVEGPNGKTLGGVRNMTSGSLWIYVVCCTGSKVYLQV